MGNEVIYPSENRLKKLFPANKPVIPTLHLLSLPGSPFYRGQSMQEILDYTMHEVEILTECGVDGFIVENHGDIPFLKPEDFPYETVAGMTFVGSKVVEYAKEHHLQVGVNCLANAAIPALAIAKSIGAGFIRVNQFVNAYVANEGFVEGLAGKILRYRKNIDGEDISIFADVHVKHGSHAIVADRPVKEQAKDVLFFSGDVLVCTGYRTGDAPSDEEIDAIKVSPNVPVVAGSGINPENVERVFSKIDGAIIASYFKKDGVWYNTIDRDRVLRFMEVVHKIRS